MYSSVLYTRCRSITLRSVQPQTVVAAESHDQKNARLNRPLSPHLSIYQYQLTTVLSVSHRATGIILTAYAAGLAGGEDNLPRKAKKNWLNGLKVILLIILRHTLRFSMLVTKTIVLAKGEV